MSMEARTGAGDMQYVTALRRELAQVERALREHAEREGIRLARAERDAWREARDACHVFDRIRTRACARLEAIRAGSSERFSGERQLAEKVLLDANRADAAYTIVSFAGTQERLLYLRGGADRDRVIAEVLAQGGVYTHACAGRHFLEIVR